MNSLELLVARADQVLWPAHGDAIRNPAVFLKEFIAHRKKREQQISHCIESGLCEIPVMVKHMYKDVDERLHAPAAMSVLAHIEYMISTGRVECEGTADLKSVYRNC